MSATPDRSATPRVPDVAPCVAGFGNDAEMADSDDAVRRAAEERARHHQAAKAWEAWPPEDARSAEEQAAAEQFEKASAWLRVKWGDAPAPACPYCGNRDWEVGRPTRMVTYGRRDLKPVFPVACTNCGNTVYIDAELAGLAAPQNES